MVTRDQLVRASDIFKKLYFVEQHLFLNNKRIYEIRFLDDQSHEVSLFDPYEGVTEVVPEGIQPARCSLQVTYTEPVNDERNPFAQWITLSESELNTIYEQIH